MTTGKPAKAAHEIQYALSPEPETDTIEVTDDGGTARLQLRTLDEAAAWLIEHGEYAATMPLPDGDDVLLVLPEPKHGLFSRLELDPIALVAIVEYAGGHALVVRCTQDSSLDDEDELDEAG